MKPLKLWLRNLLMLGHMVAVLSSGATPGAAAEPTDPLSAGIIDFAGRVSRNYWHLFGPEKQSELEDLNRELREARQQFETATDESPKTAAANRARVASDHLLEIVRRSPRLIRVDLTSARPTFAPSGPIEQPGDTGALLFEVAAGGEGDQFSTAWGDLANPPRREDVQKERRSHSLVRVDVGARGATYAVVGLEHLPVGRTTLLIDFHRPGHAPDAAGCNHPAGR